MSVKRITVKDISNELGLSLGTISNAMTGKSTVSAETRELVLATAERMGYEVNRAAQSLARSPIRIGVLLPSFWIQHYGFFEKGIRQVFADIMDYNVSGIFRYVSSQYASEEISSAIDEFIFSGVQGVIVCPAFDPGYRVYLDRLHKAQVPTVLLGSDIDDANRLCCVSVDAYAAGQLAGEFLRLIIPADKKCIILIGNKDMNEHSVKVKGFVESFENKEQIGGVYETQDEPDVAYLVAQKALNSGMNIGGIFIATGNSNLVCKYLAENGLDGKIKVVGTDIFPEMRENVEKGIVQGIIHQGQVRQGRTATLALFNYLTKGKTPESQLLVEPQLVLRTNLNRFYHGDQEEKD